ncbi:MAG: 6-phosphofructokinase [Clostridiales bacterium]|nr:6-phosphofructokinase [Clostridiales bacterium]MDD7036037.1 ATP-dependent 6-phosphofructokinase [Bacillota bacterium]MDY2920943.1 ATP-dependent 6-phosphofructokinase [Lentihominibacter sp.]
MKRIGILTSGGDAPGMNAAIRSALRTGIHLGMEVYGISRGYEGLIDGDIQKLEWVSGGDILHRGGTILKTARSSRFMEKKWQEHAVGILRAYGIEGLVVIGGEGSMKGALELSKLGVDVAVVPGTIDNDMGYTDMTIGFDTAVNTTLNLIGNIRDTSSSHERTTIIEVMGRHCGDLALYAGLGGGADVIMVPEVPQDINEVCRRVLRGQSSGKVHSIIVKAEGVDIDSRQLAEILEEMTGREARIVVPGYIQRGGSPTEADRRLASLTGAKAADVLYNDSGSRAVGTLQGEIVALDLEKAVGMKREFRMDMYNLANVLS